jgi:hypothetical protein
MHASSPYPAAAFPETGLLQHTSVREASFPGNPKPFSAAARNLGDVFPAVYAGKYEVKREDRRPRRYTFISCGNDLLLEMPDFSTLTLIPAGDDAYLAGPTDQKFIFNRNATGAIASMSVVNMSNGYPVVAQKVF